jgi:DNA repair protein RecN (Recombination protein N)
VELTFSELSSTLVETLKEKDIYPEEDMLVLSRKIMESGKSVCKINGETVTASILKEVAGYLIDIHGQQEHHSLLQKSSHLKFLDRFAKEQLGQLPKQLEEAYKVWKTVKEELEGAVTDDAERNREMSFLNFAIEEIEGARLRIGEDFELEEENKILSNSKQIVEAVAGGLRCTKSSDDNAEELISRAQRYLSRVAEYDEKLQNLEELLSNVQDMLSDFNSQAEDYIESVEDAGERFFEVEQRLNIVNQLKGKYGDSIEAVLAYKEECSQKQEKYNNYEAYLEKLRKEYINAEEICISLCKQMSEIRKKCAEKMTAAMKTALQDLNFSDVQFVLAFEKLEQFNASGFDSCEFMISLNMGEALKPLTKVASGGELSRIMLAMKSVLANQDEIPTLIFDEIDTGISGRTAQMVSEKMAQIGETHQILCITHLSQIASMADAHYLIEKSVADGRTKTGIRELSKEEIYTELARMLGGAEITEAVVQNAKEMKLLAEKIKKY